MKRLFILILTIALDATAFAKVKIVSADRHGTYRTKVYSDYMKTYGTYMFDWIIVHTNGPTEHVMVKARCFGLSVKGENAALRPGQCNLGGHKPGETIPEMDDRADEKRENRYSPVKDYFTLNGISVDYTDNNGDTSVFWIEDVK